MRVTIKMDGRVGRDLRSLYGLRWRNQVERILREHIEKENSDRKSEAVLMALKNITGHPKDRARSTGQKDQRE